MNLRSKASIDGEWSVHDVLEYLCKNRKAVLKREGDKYGFYMMHEGWADLIPEAARYIIDKAQLLEQKELHGWGTAKPTGVVRWIVPGSIPESAPTKKA